jgi:hypothetical protein
MDWLSAWWAALPLFEKILWCVAFPATTLTFVQVALELFGLGDHGADADFDTDVDTHAGDHGGAMHWFTVKGMTIFLTAFGWLGIAGSRAGLPILVTVFIGGAIGLACMFFFAWIFYVLNGLQESGSFKIKSSLYKPGRVYLSIPENRSGAGKVTVSAQGASRELAAMTDGEALPTGTTITVVDIINDQTVLVTRQ